MFRHVVLYYYCRKQQWPKTKSAAIQRQRIRSIAFILGQFVILSCHLSFPIGYLSLSITASKSSRSISSGNPSLSTSAASRLSSWMSFPVNTCLAFWSEVLTETLVCLCVYIPAFVVSVQSNSICAQVRWAHNMRTLESNSALIIPLEREIKREVRVETEAF